MHEDSFMKALFHGVIPEDIIFPYPEMDGNERETVEMILQSIRKFADAHIDAAALDRDHTLSDETLDKMRELGLFGLVIPEEYGGFGLSATAYARVMQEVGAIAPALAVTIGAHQSIGLKAIPCGTPSKKLSIYRSWRQGNTSRLRPDLEPVAMQGITTRAELSEDGSEYILNGSKIWITNGRFADIFTVCENSRSRRWR